MSNLEFKHNYYYLKSNYTLRHQKHQILPKLFHLEIAIIHQNIKRLPPAMVLNFTEVQTTSISANLLLWSVT